MNTAPAPIQFSETQRLWLSSAPIFPSELIVKSRNRSQTYQILELDSSGKIHGLENRMGFKGFVLKVADIETESIFAAKICLADDYDEDRTEQFETKLSAALRPAGELFVAPIFAGRTSSITNFPDHPKEFVCFISDWVEGETLEERCHDESRPIDPDFICSVSLELLKASRFLKAKNLAHDDLHWGNVMLRRADPSLILFREDANIAKISIIDMGSLKIAPGSPSKSKDDFLNIIKVMTEMFNRLWGYREVAASNPKFIILFKQLIYKMADEDHLRHFPQEEDLPREIKLIQENSKKPNPSESNKSFHPFEAISAEHLADDSILLKLFEASLPWFSPVLEPKPIVLSGPRGCGKSMLFRYMAAKTHLAQMLKSPDQEQELNFFGVYISCATHLQNNLIWITRKEGRAARNASSISTFFQLVVLRELLKSIAAAFEDEQTKIRYGLMESGIENLLNHINIYFRNSAIETPRLINKFRLLQFIDDIDRLRVGLHLDLLTQIEPKTILPDTFLGDITSKIRDFLPRFKKVPIVFLLDDYSSNRVPREIQSILNRIIFERRDSHYFKVSCEKFGFHPTDLDGVRIDNSREYEEVDAGSYAMTGLTDSISVKFLSGLIDRRLSIADWKGRTEALIGRNSDFRSDVMLAKHIRNEGSTQGKHYYYYGIEHLARLWSGDIATILQIVKEMFVLGDVKADTTETIPKHFQHRAIINVSKAFKERVGAYHPHGKEMSAVLNNLCNCIKEILVHGTLTKKNEPRRLYRLEMTKQKIGHLLDLLTEENQQASEVAKELLRRAIFIQPADSRGKEGVGTQTVRWEIRKIFLPSFGLSLERESYIDVKEIDSFVKLIIDPSSFCISLKSKYSLDKRQDKYTASLFSED